MPKRPVNPTAPTPLRKREKTVAPPKRPAPSALISDWLIPQPSTRSSNLRGKTMLTYGLDDVEFDPSLFEDLIEPDSKPNKLPLTENEVDLLDDDVFNALAQEQWYPANPTSELDSERAVKPQLFVDQPMPEPTRELTREQQRVVDQVEAGHNVFYTGPAGSGKSTVLKAIVAKLHEMGKSVQVIAPTGLAALQVGGITTWSFMGWNPETAQKPLHKVLGSTWADKTPWQKARKKRLKVGALIIEEISMVENQFLERMNYIMTKLRTGQYDEYDRPFGGVQLIMTGDFCQLPPVLPFQFCMICGGEMESRHSGAEYLCPSPCLFPGRRVFQNSDKWAFKSDVWEQADFVHIHLKQIHRQSDDKFVKLLQKCRLGIPFSPKEVALLRKDDSKLDGAIRILCQRDEVRAINVSFFNELNSPVNTYTCRDDVTWNYPEERQDMTLEHYTERNADNRLEKFADHRIDPTVRLREGMPVLLQVNFDPKTRLCNGSQGKIVGFEAFDFSPDKLPRVQRNPDQKFYWGLTGPRAGLMATQIKAFMKEQEDQRWPIVEFLMEDGTTVTRTIHAACFITTFLGHDDNELNLSRTQVPLTAGWAITVHKSQGMTLSRVIVNLTRAFEDGQVYVALSRATSLKGLRVEGSSEGLYNGVSADEHVLEFLKSKFGNKIFR